MWLTGQLLASEEGLCDVEYQSFLRVMPFYVSKMGSCRELFKTIEILSYCSQYIFSPVLYVVNNKHLFIKKFETHNHDTRSTDNFNLSITNLTRYQKAANYVGIKIFTHLPTHIKCVANEIQVFKTAVKKFVTHFFSIEEYYNIYSRFQCFN
jgi:hypothetical protein